MIAPLELRPYQMLCLIRAQGRKLEGAQVSVEETLRLIREYPDRPVTLRASHRISTRITTP
jgi:hypothetical protein